MSQFLLKDGRTLDLLDNHHDSKYAILFHHGTPGDSTIWQDWHEELTSQALRTISVGRPGYSLSDRNRGRRVVDACADHQEILDKFGIEHFVSIGWSGGGPHALATSLDPRCRGIISLAGVGQYGQSDLNFLEGMGPENHDEFGAALKGEDALREWMNVNALAMKNVTGNELRDSLGGLIGDADKEVLAGEFADDMAARMRRGLGHGFDGWIDDDLAFVQDWGFDLGHITVPVQIWQGDDDFMVPQSHSRWLGSKIPTAQVKFMSGEGHISLGVKHRHQIVIEMKSLLADN